MGMGKWVCHSTRDNDDYIHHHTPTGHDHHAASDDHNHPYAIADKGVGDPAFADTLLVPKHSGV
jgi:hypothetical protein